MFRAMRSFILASVCLFVACGPGGGGSGTGGGSGGGSGSGGAFLVARDSDSSGVQLARDSNGVLHLLAAPSLIDNGHAQVLYGRCSGNCGASSSWSYASVGDGFTNDKIQLAVDSAGAAHIALLESTQVTLGSCSHDCTASTNSGWQFSTVSAPGGQTWSSFPLGREFVITEGYERLVFNGQVNGSAALVLFAKSSTGYSADPLVAGTISAAQVLAQGNGVDIVASLGDSAFSIEFGTCAQNCHDVNNYTGGVFTNGNTSRLGAVRTGDGVLHVVHSSSIGAHAGTDTLVWSRCTGNCTAEASWQHEDIGDGNAARGTLDLAVRGDGTLGLLAAPPADYLHTISLQTCASNCTGGAWSALNTIDRSGDVNETWPTVTETCSGPTHVWSVGDLGRLVADSNGSFIAGYDASAYSRCPSMAAGTYSLQGRYVRLQPVR